MFAGFRSRWMMPCSCAASSASAICLRDRQRLVERDRPLRNALGQSSPFDQLHHEGTHAAALLETVDVRDVRMIQRGERPRLAREPRERSGSLANESGRTLIATSRSSLVSRARYTSPMPPAPMGRSLHRDRSGCPGRDSSFQAALRGLYGRA